MKNTTLDEKLAATWRPVSMENLANGNSNEARDNLRSDRILSASPDARSIMPSEQRHTLGELCEAPPISVSPIDELQATQLDVELLFQTLFEGRVQQAELREDDFSLPDPPLSELLNGRPMCPKCQRSDNVRKRDVYRTERGEVRNYYSCNLCGTRVPPNPTGRRHSLRTVAIVLSRYFGGESSRTVATGMLEEEE